MSTLLSKGASVRARSSFALAPLCVALSAALAASPADAAGGFTISGTPATTSAQTLTAGQTGSVSSSGSLIVNKKAAVTVSGSGVTVNNQGTISQTGTARGIQDGALVTNLVVTNGSAGNSSASIVTADADVIQLAADGADSVTLSNYGVMTSNNASKGGAQVVDFTSILTGANTVNNYATGVMTAYNADAVRPGVNGVVFNAGKIIASAANGSSSDGIDAQTNSGVQITNSGLIQGARHGITGGQDSTLAMPGSFLMTIANAAGGVIQGMDGSGVNIDANNGGYGRIELVTITNAGTIVGNGVTGDGDGVDVDGLVNITNLAGGIIRSANAYSAVSAGLAYSEGITVGGGTITNSGLIEGLVSAGNTNALGRGITLTGNDIPGSTTGAREGLYGNAVVINNAGGVIRGQNDSAIAVSGAKSGYTVSITNNAGGVITGGGATSAAIQGGLDNDTVTNAGLIDGSSSHHAIDLGGGNNSVNIVGGSASVLGSIDGGSGGINAMTLNPGAGNSFVYAGSISDFATVEVMSGRVALSGVSTYTGTTTVDSGATLELDGANRLATASALDLAGGTLKITGASGGLGQTFASLSLSGASTLDLGGSSVVFGSLGSIGSGATLAIDGYVASSTGYAFRLLSSYSSADAAFMAFLAGTTIDGKAVTYRLDGAYTDVSAVPEPANVALLLAGLGLLGFVSRRRKRSDEV